jgi:hypothetical protein
MWSPYLQAYSYTFEWNFIFMVDVIKGKEIPVAQTKTYSVWEAWVLMVSCSAIVLWKNYIFTYFVSALKLKNKK